MDFRKAFAVKPGSRVRLAKIDPSWTAQHESHAKAAREIDRQIERMDRFQYLLYADARQSLLIVLQGLDAAGKDGVIRHLFTGMNPQGTFVAGFKEPTRVELAHDFTWRAHLRAPGRGEIAICNRSHYEDVLVVRVHGLVPRAVWSRRYAMINDYEKILGSNGTRVLKFYLHIDPDEQLRRFRERLEDPMRHWKISENDYAERELWPQYVAAYEDALGRTSTRQAPWYVIPSNHKWFRNLAISTIVADTMADMGLALPPTQVDLAQIRRKFHAETRRARRREKQVGF
jgi:PPK2 family polyphosphate:nucleotide phosphotransferase